MKKDPKSVAAAVYLMENDPFSYDFSRGRLTKLIYLADWKAAQRLGRQITATPWYFHNYGPYVPELMDMLLEDAAIEEAGGENLLGKARSFLRLHPEYDPAAVAALDENERKILSEVLDETSGMNWTQFIKKIYATYPVEQSSRYSDLDLVAFAREEKEAARAWK